MNVDDGRIMRSWRSCLLIYDFASKCVFVELSVEKNNKLLSYLPISKIVGRKLFISYFQNAFTTKCVFLESSFTSMVRVETSYYHHLAFIIVQKLFLCHSVDQDVVFSVTFNNISVISWRSVLLVEEIGITEENNRPAASH